MNYETALERIRALREVMDTNPSAKVSDFRESIADTRLAFHVLGLGSIHENLMRACETDTPAIGEIEKLEEAVEHTGEKHLTRYREGVAALVDDTRVLAELVEAHVDDPDARQRLLDIVECTPSMADRLIRGTNIMQNMSAFLDTDIELVPEAIPQAQGVADNWTMEAAAAVAPIHSAYFAPRNRISLSEVTKQELSEVTDIEVDWDADTHYASLQGGAVVIRRREDNVIDNVGENPAIVSNEGQSKIWMRDGREVSTQQAEDIDLKV